MSAHYFFSRASRQLPSQNFVVERQRETMSFSSEYNCMQMLISQDSDDSQAGCSVAERLTWILRDLPACQFKLNIKKCRI